MIPISAVRFLENNTKGQAFILQERERIFGVEQYVTEVSFYVLEYDNINVAADVAAGFNPDNLVVSFTSKSLSDGQAVRE